MTKQDTVTFVPANLVLPTARFLTEAEQAQYESNVKAKYPSEKVRQSLINPREGSNLFKVIELQNQGINVASLPELSLISEQQRDWLSRFYADAPEICLRSAGDPYEPNDFLAKDLARQIGRTEFSNPLIVTGLSLEEADSPYGLRFVTTDKTKIYEAPDFKNGNNGRRFNRINPDYSVEFEDNGKFFLYTRENGFSRLGVNRDGFMYSDWGNLGDSNSGGRVVVVDAEGVAHKNLDALKKETEVLITRQRKEREDLIARLRE